MGVLNVHVTQKFSPGQPNHTKPHLLARVARQIFSPFKLVKACKYWTVSVFCKLSGQPPHFPLRDASPIDLEMAENGLRASEMPWMAPFHNSLNRTFGFKVADSMMTEIDDLEM